MNLLYCLRRAEQFHGSSVASYSGDTAFTWAEFSRRVHRAAAFFRDLGIRKNDRVAVWMLNSHEYLEIYYASLIAGIIVVPLNTRWHENDAAFALADSESCALILDDAFSPPSASLPALRRIIYAGRRACPAGMIPYGYSDTGHCFDEPSPEDTVGLFYTSGTTGGPKGVILSHANLWANTMNMALALSVGQTRGAWLHAAPMFHLADLGALHSITASGATHAYLPSFQSEAFLQIVERFRVTETLLVPTMLSLVLNHPSFARYDLSSLQTIAYGASPMPLPLIEEAMSRLPHARFHQGYGMTETSPLLTALDHENHSGPTVTSAGRPVLGVEVRIVDGEDRDVPTGHSGEVIARGANVMQGYWKRPEITAHVLRGGWMHTGDIGRFDENGFVTILDRAKDMIKPGSENVYSPEVESMIAAHPAVLEAAVIGVPDPKWGEAIRAVVSLRPSAALSEADLILWCRGRMTHFKCPTSVVFLDALPKSGTGKIQKNVLRELYGR